MGRANGRVIQPLTIAIIGGGAGGTLAAIHLAVHPSSMARRIMVIEPAAELGVGLAYGTVSAAHLLNVRVRAMSAFPDDPDHFLDWLRGSGLEVDGADFVPRMLYGPYLRETLARALARDAMARLEHRRARAVGMRMRTDRAWSITLDDGRDVLADRVVLATGHASAPVPIDLDLPGVVRDPWSGTGVAAVAMTARVLIAGTGLTAVDVALSLRDGGHRGDVMMVSRHGLLPEAHRVTPAPNVAPFVKAGSAAAGSARDALRAFRAATRGADDWRQVVDGFRSHTVAVWRGLPPHEQRRFLRHLARPWDVHRHRMAPQVATAIDLLRSSGGLTVARGRVTALVADGGRIRVALTGSGITRQVVVDSVVLCLGPSPDPSHDPFLASLLVSRVATRHRLGLGLDVDIDGRVLAPDGVPHASLWALGSLRKGAEWEATGIPELRGHAQGIAASISRLA